MNEFDALFICDEHAPENHLKWLREDDGQDDNQDETIPCAEGLYYELTFDDMGRVFPTVALRYDDGEPIAGARLSTEELMTFAMWAFQNALAHEKFRAESINGTLMRSWVTEKVKNLLTFIKDQVPDSYLDLVVDDQKEVIDTVTRAAAKEIAARKRELAAEYKGIERSHAKHIVQLSRLATLGTPQEREEALSDPILQQVICKAVQTVADTKRTS